MSPGTHFRPVSDKHSIKEAVLSIFLSAPIADPQSFAPLLKHEFKNKFNVFEPLSGLTVSVLPKAKDEVSYEKEPNKGFKFLKTDGESLRRVLQGVNEPNRNYLSYHALDYTRWNPFFDEFLECVNTIARRHQEFEVQAIALHYIDEFNWLDGEKPNLRLIFREESDYVPTSFMNNHLPQIDLLFTLNQNEESGIIHYERLNISVIPTIQPTITISHSITNQLDTPININELFNQDKFKEMIIAAHKHNKTVLKNLLNAEIAMMINLS